ncbi:MAG: bifunctional glutamate N-acetyltransferase/amino-acid acetyltransferase ArgJ [Aquificaceae bacterium]|nr:bifunctional glutamate N-acetyltransferase/amino-acid acetyltransferase ArgJ [Aquificaceae bacterium]MDW8236867.1 bifunctional glutamate N-acetyltransferase/amino-acid acetyltransferase ArgJ [Aquificaceae bacterium]
MEGFESVLMGVGYAGLKQAGNDILVVYLKDSRPASILFTKNYVKSESVLYTMQNFSGVLRALVVNSGNANCAVGSIGFEHAEMMAKRVAKNLGISQSEVAVFSTGIIGKPLDIDGVLRGIDSACFSLKPLDLKLASETISTTDRFPKLHAIFRNGIYACGFAKGAGMIHPNMATMLAFMFLDAETNKLREIHEITNEESFNSITVDGCTSTNDCSVLISTSSKSADDNLLTELIRELSLSLAKMIVLDGEGATKIIKVSVINASSKQRARALASLVANSNLVKAAIYGLDPNWGRIIAALGSGSERVDINKLSIKIGSHTVFDQKPLTPDSEMLLSYLKFNKEVLILIDLKEGNSEWSFYSSDLTPEYVNLNARYST